jgi:cytochrome c-type biogenesis protein CcmH
MVSRALGFCFLLFLALPGFAEIAGFPFETDVQEQRFRDLAAELRCLVCQNQSLADSNAGLAQDLRSELYQQILQGNSKAQIVNFMTERYGDFILYKPRFSAKTLLLWLAPILLFIIGIFCLIRFSKIRKQVHHTPATEEELQKIHALLQAEEQKK